MSNKHKAMAETKSSANFYIRSGQRDRASKFLYHLLTYFWKELKVAVVPIPMQKLSDNYFPYEIYSFNICTS